MAKWVCGLCLLAVAATLFEVRAQAQTSNSNMCSLVPNNTECSALPMSCINCNFDTSCLYGANITVSCSPKVLDDSCEGDQNFTRTMLCMYCYQLPPEKYSCNTNTSCLVRGTPPSRYLANCTVNDDTLCFSNRTFNKWLPCSYSNGKRWSTAVLLSFTVGGFGIDRFYLEQWGTAVGKLVTFGGLGVWSILDVILIATGYLTPGDGSSYVY